MALELLLVEHRNETTLSLSSYFERCGYIVHVALDLKKAEEILMSNLIDVVVAAQELRQGFGSDLLQFFDLENAKRPSIILLCHTQTPILQTENIDAVIHAPIDLKKLHSAVDACVCNKNIQRPTPTPRSFQIPLDLTPPTSEHGLEHIPVDLQSTDEVEQDGPHPILAPYDITQFLLEKSRAKATGILSLELEGNKCEVALLEGVCVGARDTLRENLLGERLRRSGLISEEQLRRTMEIVEREGGRIGETLLRQKFIESPQLLDAIEQQAQERLTRAVGMKDGWYVFRHDENAARCMALTHLDLMQAILAWFTRAPDNDAIDAFIDKHTEHEIFQTDDFEAGLLAYSRVVQQGPLPQHLLMGPVPLMQLLEDLEAQGEDRFQLAGHLFAMSLAGMIEAGQEEAEVRAKLPAKLPPDEQVIWDKDIVNALCEEWLRVQGRSDYEMLSVPPNMSDGELLTAIAEYKERFGAFSLPMERLGPSISMAEDLHRRIEIAVKRLLEPAKRKEYDATLQPMPTVESRSTVTQTSEALFLTAKQYLEEGNFAEAEHTFQNAVDVAPREPDYKAYLGWVHILRETTNLKKGVELIKEAHRMNPAAMRPLFFLGMVALRTEKLDFAQQFLQECARRAPEDLDVKLALQSLKPIKF